MKISLFGSVTRIAVALSFVLIGIYLSLPALGQSSDSGSAVADAQGDTISDPPRDWAGELEARDPLATKSQITLDDLERGLEHPEQRKWVIQRYLSMVPLSSEQQREFLESAFQHPSVVVRRQAAVELERLELLSDVVRQTLIEWIRTGEPTDAESAIVGLQFLPLKGEEVDQVLVDSLLDALNSASLKVRVAAARQLENLGPASVPILLQAMQDPARSHEEPADILSRIIRDAPAPTHALPAAPEIESVPRTAPAEVQSKSLPATETLPTLRRELDEGDAELVRVYYGTNREVLENPPEPKRALVIWLSVFACAASIAIWSLSRTRQGQQSWYRHLLRRIVVSALVIGVMLWSAQEMNLAFRELMSPRQGVEFGYRRSNASVIHYGYCDVSIPPTHVLGEVERPTLGPVDEADHVVLKQVAMLEETQFYAALNEALDQFGDTSRDCLLFVHGYNVSFDKAARRAAQIDYDLRFDGTTMFYSWPSRASMRHYFSDRNEIQFSHRLIKQFLEDLLANVEVERFHVIGHSMGADAICQAIVELDPEGKVFDQIILAAPDIDAETFKSQILPRLRGRGNRTTMYCSQNDLALHASNHFNDTPRAGDSSKGPLVATGLDTIDASNMDTELLGHSYYGNCLRLLEDLRVLVEQNRPPEERKLEPQLDVSDGRYWKFIE